MESQQQISKALNSIRLQFSKFNQQAACSFQLTRSYLQGSSPTLICQQILFSIIKVDSSNRTQWMVSALILLTQKYTYFSKHPGEAEECCRYLQYKKFAACEEVITYGSDPDYFYIILQGQVSVFIKRTIEEVEQERRRAESKDKNQHYEIDHDTQMLNKKHFIQKGVCKFKFVTHIEEGESFGELGMLYHKPRMAMIVARTPCVFGILKKEDYVSIFFEQQKMLRNRKKKFISQVVLTQLKNLKYEAMQGILYRFEQINLRINEFLFKENQIFNSFYIVFEGEILLFNWIGRFKKPIARIGQGGVICAEELKGFLAKNQFPTLKYSAEVASSNVILYKLQASEILKIFDYKEVFSSIIKYLPQVNHERPKLLKPILKEHSAAETNHKYDKYDIKSYFKTLMIESIPKTSKQAVGAVRLKRKQTKKENTHRKSSVTLSKFKLNMLGKLNRHTENNYIAQSLNSHRLSFSSVNNH